MTSQNNADSVEKLYEAQKKLFEVSYSHWIEHVLFSNNWWLLLMISIVPWIIWWIFVDKKRLLEISFMGGLVTITALSFDTMGNSFLLWTYGYQLIQMLPTLNPVDIALLPVLHMFLYQWFPKWKWYIIAHIVLALIGSFIAEPLFGLTGIYITHGWKYGYSFPIYIAIGIFFKWLIQKIKILQANAK